MRYSAHKEFEYDPEIFRLSDTQPNQNPCHHQISKAGLAVEP